MPEEVAFTAPERKPVPGLFAVAIPARAFAKHAEHEFPPSYRRGRVMQVTSAALSLLSLMAARFAESNIYYIGAACDFTLSLKFLANVRR